MINSQQEKIIIENLSKMETAEEAFNYLGNTFDLKNTKISGAIVGPAFRSGLIKAIKLLNPPLKK